MKLSKIEIVNYRSIKNVSIRPEPQCQGFVGVNESGKSNLLTAISLLSPDSKLNKDDVRLEGTEEARDQEASVEYYFDLSASDMEQIIADLMASIYAEDTLPSLEINGKKVGIEKFFSTKTTGLYYCDIAKEEKTGRYYLLKKGEIVSVPWLKKVVRTTATITTESGKSIALSKYRFVATDCIPESERDYFRDCTTEDINAAFGSIQISYVQDNLPNVVYWKYDKQFLLPNSVNMEEFCDDPSICSPLKSMFQLGGYDNISDALNRVKDQSSRLASMLKKVSDKSTEYLQKVWKDYKNVRFELRANGENIDIHIQDSENFYTCEQRSDGFKRFITFLLALSAPVNNGEITNSIIVVDEPDTGIHILGQKCLVQELIRISKNNLVFYSTHSIFMIDRKEPSRHFIVSKKKEITSVNQVTSSTYTDDEVIFNALGYSIFETLKPKNIIFEGWADKRVFEIAIATKKGKAIKGLSEFGMVHSTGVKTITGIAKDLELANRRYCVISDSDAPALDKRKEYQNKEQCEGPWQTYDDVLSGIFTLEDFIKHSAFKKPLEQVKEAYSELGEFDYKTFETKDFRREEYIKSWIASHVSDKDHKKTIMKEIKNVLYSNLTGANIEDRYYTFLEELNQRLSSD